MLNFIIFAVVLLILIFSNACTESLPIQKLGSDKTYKRDMIICVNDICREGSISMPIKASNKIRIDAPNDLDQLVMSNCSGEWDYPNAWNLSVKEKSGPFGWFSKTVDKKSMREFSYYPTGEEFTSACPMYFYSIQKSGNIQSWGFIDWQTEGFKLNGEMICNGAKRLFEGVEVCQTREGLLTKLSFDEVVAISPDVSCGIKESQSNNFEFEQPKGFCAITFLGKDSRKKGRVTLIGYEGLLVR